MPDVISVTTPNILPNVVSVSNSDVVQTIVNEPDLITKVSQFKKPIVVVSDNNTFDYKEIEAIKDPIAKEIATKAYKSLQGDYTRKTQELAEQRKNLEAAQQKVAVSNNWSPERIQQELLSNPEFLVAAQLLDSQKNPQNSGLTDEQYSVLNESEKGKLATVPKLEQEINKLRQESNQAIIRAEISQRDAQLQSKYADYNPITIDQATQELSSMNLSSVREYVYKAKHHDDHVKAAYEMGKQDGQGLNQNRLNGITLDGGSTNINDDIPTKNKGENDQSFFVRLAQHRLAQSRKK